MVNRRNVLLSIERLSPAGDSPGSASTVCYGEVMRVALATDHAGFPLKQPIADWLARPATRWSTSASIRPIRSTIPDYIAPAARAVATGDCEFGIVIGGSGTGEQIVANKIRGIRCVEAADPVTARLGREHNDANVLSMGARIIGSEVALACVEAFMTASFQGGRHARRVDKIRPLEEPDAG